MDARVILAVTEVVAYNKSTPIFVTALLAIQALFARHVRMSRVNFNGSISRVLKF